MTKLHCFDCGSTNLEQGSTELGEEVVACPSVAVCKECGRVTSWWVLQALADRAS